jgi:hypothetical protein
MSANSSTSLVGLDFDTIKNNLIRYLQSQDTFKDYNFLGSGLNTLLDVLAYNTQYNAFYLNMVSNEMFLDTALQRSSVVSHAKLMNYTPQSSISPTAFVDITVSGVTSSSVTLPSYTNFLSESIDGINYNFVTAGSTTVNVVNNIATFNNIELKQGIPVTYSYTVDSTSNPNYIFELPDSNIDTSSLLVQVQNSVSNTAYQVFTLADSYLELNGSSPVYFLEESLDGNYQINFGNGILGKKLSDNNIINVKYLVSQGTSAHGANNFVLMDSVSGFGPTLVTGLVPASNGQEKESIDSIKYTAPKSFSAQKRAVTKDDYITLLQQNNIGLTFDAVNVWGGEENNPPIYGQVFICLKPTGQYSITDSQKKELINSTIKPISVVTVEPTIVDPDYTFANITADVVYNPKMTNYSSSQIHDIIKTSISNFAANNLNTFNSTFSGSDIAIVVKGSDPSIVTSEINIKIQKRLYPNLTTPTTYTLHYNTILERGLFASGITSSPSLSFYSTVSANTVYGVYLEEIPSSTSSVESVSVINPGYSYQYKPTVTISGDGSGAEAEAVLNPTNGSITSIRVINSGNNYTYATVSITPSVYDTTGTGGAAIASLNGGLGGIRSYYFDTNNIKTILNPNVGTIDYTNGVITLNSFNPTNVDNPLGQFSVSATPYSQILSSNFNTILTVDPYDPTAIVVNVRSQ